MKFASKIGLSGLVVALSAVACATATEDDGGSAATGGASGTGATSGTGGATSGTGATSGSGGVTGSGGAGSGGVFGTGGAGSGGAASGGAASGGAASGGAASGGAASGGAASGGAASGGASSGGTNSGGTGGVVFGGDCAGKSTFAQWSSATGATGDRVIARCQQISNTCVGRQLNVDYLWECTESHVNNCNQTPGTTNAWMFIGECVEDTGMGGDTSTP